MGVVRFVLFTEVILTKNICSYYTTDRNFVGVLVVKKRTVKR